MELLSDYTDQNILFSSALNNREHYQSQSKYTDSHSTGSNKLQSGVSDLQKSRVTQK